VQSIASQKFGRCNLLVVVSRPVSIFLRVLTGFFRFNFYCFAIVGLYAGGLRAWVSRSNAKA
jgi:hypothetical protein